MFKKLTKLLMIPFLLMNIVPVAAEELTTKIPVEATNGGIIVIEGERNLPAETTIQDKGSFVLTFSDPEPGDVYEYKIRQIIGNEKNKNYDDTVYECHVYILNLDDKLSAVTVLNVGGGTEKPSVAFFNNELIPPTVEISKVDATNGDELPGATLVIKDSKGNTVTSWVSTKESHKVKLEPGTYTLTEITAPYGYEMAETITFEVNRDGLVGSKKVTMVDAPMERDIVISKVDVGGEELKGAQIKIFDKDGNVVHEYTTNGKKHTFKLVPGDYTLHEEVAPNGYLAITDLDFTLNVDGTVKLNKAHGDVEIVDGVVVITDRKIEKDVVISKVDVGGNELPGAQIKIYDKDGKVVHEYTTNGQKHTFKLDPGKYTLHEEVAPNGYLAITDLHFTLKEDGTITLDRANGDVEIINGVLVITDQKETTPTKKEVIISKVDVGGNELTGAQIQILDNNGKVIYRYTTNGKKHSFKLEPGTYTLHEEVAPNGYLAITDLKFTLDKDGKVTLNSASGDVQVVNGVLVITDRKAPTTSATPTPTAKPFSGYSTPRTSDTFNAGLMSGLFGFSLITAIALMFKLKKAK